MATIIETDNKNVYQTTDGNQIVLHYSHAANEIKIYNSNMTSLSMDSQGISGKTTLYNTTKTLKEFYYKMLTISDVVLENAGSFINMYRLEERIECIHEDDKVKPIEALEILKLENFTISVYIDLEVFKEAERIIESFSTEVGEVSTEETKQPC
jgi:hypothetical protein